jgi:hypothetical protein
MAAPFFTNVWRMLTMRDDHAAHDAYAVQHDRGGHPMPGQIRDDAELFIHLRPVSGSGPVRQIIARYTAWTDGRWQVRIPGPEPVTIPGDASTTAVDAMTAILHAGDRD